QVGGGQRQPGAGGACRPGGAADQRQQRRHRHFAPGAERIQLRQGGAAVVVPAPAARPPQGEEDEGDGRQGQQPPAGGRGPAVGGRRQLDVPQLVEGGHGAPFPRRRAPKARRSTGSTGRSALNASTGIPRRRPRSVNAPWRWRNRLAKRSRALRSRLSSRRSSLPSPMG